MLECYSTDLSKVKRGQANEIIGAETEIHLEPSLPYLYRFSTAVIYNLAAFRSLAIRVTQHRLLF